MSSIGGVFGHQVVTGVRAAKEGLSCAVAAPVWQCADSDVEAAIELLDGVEMMVTAMRSALLVQAEERSLRERTGAPSTGRWLVERFRWSPSRAGAAMAEARMLQERTVVADALADGAMTKEQALAVNDPAAVGRRPGRRGGAGAGAGTCRAGGAAPGTQRVPVQQGP
jgi:hypothetical protein